MLTQSDLLRMSQAELAAIVATAHPIDHAAVAGHQYLGIDLSLPAFVNKLLWKTFRKTFYADPEQNLVRGWNVKLEQHGIDGPRIPLRDGKGREKSFGHYHLLKRTNERFPGGWAGPDFLTPARPATARSLPSTKAPPTSSWAGRSSSSARS